MHLIVIDVVNNYTYSQQYINNIIRSMGDALIVINPDETIKVVNPAAERLLEYTEEELVDKSIESIFFQKDLKKKWFEELKNRGLINNIEETLLTKDNAQPILKALR